MPIITPRIVDSQHPPSEMSLRQMLKDSVFGQTGLRYLESLSDALVLRGGAEAALILVPCPKGGQLRVLLAGRIGEKVLPDRGGSGLPCHDSLEYELCADCCGCTEENLLGLKIPGMPGRYELKAPDGTTAGLILLFSRENAQTLSLLPQEVLDRTLHELREIDEERRLRKKLLKLRKLSEVSPTPLYFKDLQGRYIQTNAAFASLFGKTPEELTGKSIEALFPAAIAAGYREKDNQLIASGQDQYFETGLTDASGNRREVIFQKRLILDDQGRPEGITGTVIDITDRKAAERRIRQLAYYDQLTGLPNQSRFLDHLSALIQNNLQQQQSPPAAFALMMLELGRTPVIHDSLGMSYASMVTKALAQRLANWVELGDLVARIEGGKFALCLSRADTPEQASLLARNLVDLLAQPITLKDMEVHCSGHVGIALFPSGGETPQGLFKNADIALWSAKSRGSAGFQFFSQEMTEKAMERLILETHLRKALSRKELHLHYQPQFQLATGELCGVEALMRWSSPARGQVPPGVFIPLAEESGLIFPMGEWLIEEACSQAAAWQKAKHPPVTMALNLSGLQFRHSDIVESVHRALKKTGLAPQWLELELTESMVMEQTDENLRTMERLKDMGVSLAIDDFGTGYSSLGYLKRFPIDTLKIDRSFIRDIPNDADDVAIADAIIAMAHRLGLKVTAEGVETPEQSAFLHQHRCDIGQGFLWGRPGPASEIENLFGKKIPSHP